MAPLASAAGCSLQMARRYTLGEALPDYKTLLKMGEWFNVLPGWLLFGDNQTPPEDLVKVNLLHMDMELFSYILKKAIPLIQSTSDDEETLCFIAEVLQDAMHMKTDKKMRMKLIDVAMSSASRFQTPQSNAVNTVKKKMKQ